MPSLPVRAVLAAVFFVGCGALAGMAVFEGEPWPWRVFLGTLTVAASTMVVASAVYYAYRLNVLAAAIVLLLVSAAVWATMALVRKKPRIFHAEIGAEAPRPSFAAHPWRTLIGALAAAAFLAAISFGFSVLKEAATVTSIRSPWDVVPRLFFIVFFLAAAGMLASSLGGFAPRLSLASATGLALLATSVAATVYAVGYGFDPFIHQATEMTIFRDGLITPKPLYYVGQYAFVTMLARLLGGNVVAIDTWLVPIAFALIVPCAYWSLRKAFGFPASASAAAAACVLLLPLSSFAASTPQGLANALFLMTAFLALPSVVAGAFPRAVLIILAAATATVHPLAGIPLVIFVTLAYLASGERLRGVGEAARWLVLGEVALAGSVALPIVFIMNSIVSGIGVSINVEALKSPVTIFEDLQSGPAVATRQFMAVFDLVYSWRAWREAALIGAALAGIAVLWRRTRGGMVYLAAAAVFFANFVLLRSVVRFPFLISYERSNYADRILELTLFILAPMAAAALAALFTRAARSFSALRVGVMVVLAALMTSSLYLAYPRRDKYESSRGWSTSAADVEAVRIINKDAAGRPFIALANQSVSAAAVREFGFKRYFASQDPERPGLLFYYPIPTGDALYKKFLDMNEQLGSYAAAEKAMDLAGVDTAYYVVSYYWWDAQRIILTAKRQADRSWNVQDKDYVFKYERR
ncbi:MAG TPA: hypothetical protein VL500_01600 [Candidatus Eisenbacteria bacterium]|nr:hypothetical protein [Candidatus Eisenbacteria bacterium]